ncbi:serine/threonine-protein phosphatase [Streptomyces tanashiensis]
MAREEDGEKFVTAIIAEIHTDEQVAVLLNCGHPPPMIVRTDGSTDLPPPPAYALPLGLGMHGGEPPRTHRTRFAPGDQLLLYTDGVRDADGAFYPLRERAGLLGEADTEQALEALREDVVRHANGPLHDDAAMLLLRYRRR